VLFENWGCIGFDWYVGFTCACSSWSVGYFKSWSKNNCRR